MSLNDAGQDVIKGLIWLSAVPQDVEVGRVLSSLAINCYNKIPGMGPRAPRIGNAVVWALSAYVGLQSLTHLAYMKVRVRYGTAQNQIEKALTAKAAELNVSRSEVEEIGVPDYGLTDIGVGELNFGDFTARTVIAPGNKVVLTWINNEKGKEQKSIPGAVKSEFAEELRGTNKDIQKMLPAQRDRIDSMYLLKRSWTYAQWRERYCDHPLVGCIARRLLWVAEDGDDRIAFLPTKGAPEDVSGQPIPDVLLKEATITLWHPIDWSPEEVLNWRLRVESLEVVQPFKQAHREVYLLTDAERNTDIYSNRFAAHIVKQHQFNALCGARGWKNQLRLMVDDCYYPAHKILTEWGIRAEFWIDGIGDEYGEDTNDSGTFLYLATDQVRFYDIQSEKNMTHASGGGYSVGYGSDGAEESMQVDSIPALVFSEIMRDVDLFVGVASIGNDPSWQDTGRDGANYRDYWQSYSFGKLSDGAEGRKTILERLVPRLKIADKCTFDGRFLKVVGSKRVYKIHLGSGNILMEPNDQYLCIVAKQSTSAKNQVMLPFEGDNTMSIILSKAMMLADDHKIKDPTILSQILR
jgi:hypothetical protein